MTEDYIVQADRFEVCRSRSSGCIPFWSADMADKHFSVQKHCHDNTTDRDFCFKFFLFSAGKITGALCVVFGIIIIAPLLPIIASKFSGLQEKAKLERTLALEKQTSNDNSSESSDDVSNTSESSEDAVKAVTFAEEQETFEILKYSKRPTFETPGHRGRPRSITVH